MKGSKILGITIFTPKIAVSQHNKFIFSNLMKELTAISMKIGSFAKKNDKDELSILEPCNLLMKKFLITLHALKDLAKNKAYKDLIPLFENESTEGEIASKAYAYNLR